jgi:hypothetical protein
MSHIGQCHFKIHGTPFSNTYTLVNFYYAFTLFDFYYTFTLVNFYYAYTSVSGQRYIQDTWHTLLLYKH